MSFRPTLLLAFAALGLTLFLNPSMVGAQCNGDQLPPDNSEVDQYLESVPGTCGDEKAAGSTGKGDGAGLVEAERVLPPGTSEQLEALGADGATVAELTASTSTVADRRGAQGSRPDRTEDGVGFATDDGAGGSAVAAIAGAISGQSDDGAGVLLPGAILVILAAGVATAALRSRARSRP